MPSPFSSNDVVLAQNVQPKAATPGVAQDSSPPLSSGSSSGGSPFATMMPILMILIIFVPFMFLSSRRQKKEQQARASLKKGDRVMTTAGLIGELMESDDRVAKVKIAPGVTVQIVANTVSPFVEAATKTPASSAPKELKEAKAVPEKK